MDYQKLLTLFEISIRKNGSYLEELLNSKHYDLFVLEAINLPLEYDSEMESDIGGPRANIETMRIIKNMLIEETTKQYQSLNELLEAVLYNGDPHYIYYLDFAFDHRYRKTIKYILQQPEMEKYREEYTIHLSVDRVNNEIMNNIVEKCKESGRFNIYIENIYIENIKNVEKLLNWGLVPNYIDNEIEYAIYLLLNGYNEYDQKFWLGHTSRYLLRSIHYWCYISYDYAQHLARKNPSSVPFMVKYPELLYSQSKRPINDMSQYFIEKHLNITNKSYINVTRYTDGMRRGLFHGENNGKYIGTFYYYEPQSTTALTYQTVLKCQNKVDAVEKLIEEMNRLPHLSQELIIIRDELRKTMNNTPISQEYYDWCKGKLHENLMYTPQKYLLIRKTQAGPHQRLSILLVKCLQVFMQLVMV